MKRTSSIVSWTHRTQVDIIKFDNFGVHQKQEKILSEIIF